MHTHNIVNGVRVELSNADIAAIETIVYTRPSPPATPTKEELFAQLNALSAQIQALE